jgi:hypothetical protein
MLRHHRSGGGDGPVLAIAEKAEVAAGEKYYPCKLLFVHRDAERENPIVRHAEIRAAVEELAGGRIQIPAVAVVPVRMLEAWLLFNEQAIRRAAGNPNGSQDLNLPPLNRLEDRPDPKVDLQFALRTASGLQGRRLKKFDEHRAFWRITDHVRDLSPLRQLPAFRQLEASLQQLRANDWRPGFYGQ